MDRRAAVTPTRETGRLAFLATNWTPGGGLSAADIRCGADAAAADPTFFVDGSRSSCNTPRHI